MHDPLLFIVALRVCEVVRNPDKFRCVKSVHVRNAMGLGSCLERYSRFPGPIEHMPAKPPICITIVKSRELQKRRFCRSRYLSYNYMGTVDVMSLYIQSIYIQTCRFQDFFALVYYTAGSVWESIPWTYLDCASSSVVWQIPVSYFSCSCIFSTNMYWC